MNRRHVRKSRETSNDRRPEISWDLASGFQVTAEA